MFGDMLDQFLWVSLSFEPPRDKTNKLTCAPSEDSDQPGHPPSLIRVFAVRSMGSKGPKLSSCGQRRLWSDWADAQADLSPCWAHMQFCWFCHEAVHFIINLRGCVGWLASLLFTYGKNRFSNDLAQIIKLQGKKWLNCMQIYWLGG